MVIELNFLQLTSRMSSCKPTLRSANARYASNHSTILNQEANYGKGR